MPINRYGYNHISVRINTDITLTKENCRYAEHHEKVKSPHCALSVLSPSTCSLTVLLTLLDNQNAWKVLIAHRQRSAALKCYTVPVIVNKVHSLSGSNRKFIVSCILFLGDSPASEFYVPTFRNILFHFHRLCTAPFMKMEQTVCSETSASKIQTLGNYPKEIIQHSKHVAIFKSRIHCKCFI